MLGVESIGKLRRASRLIAPHERATWQKPVMRFDKSGVASAAVPRWLRSNVATSRQDFVTRLPGFRHATTWFPVLPHLKGASTIRLVR